MVQAVVILIFLLARMRELLAWSPGPAPRLTLLEASLPYVAAACAGVGFHIWCLWAGLRLDRRGSWRLIDRSHLLMTLVRLLVLGVTIYSVVVLRWDAWVRSRMGDRVLLDELAIALPTLVILGSTWWSIEPVERRVREAMLISDLDQGRTIVPILPRRLWVWNQLRHHVLLLALPICLIVAWSEAAARVPVWLRAWGHDSAAARLTAWNDTLQWAGALGVLALTPLLIRTLWDTVRLRGGDLEKLIAQACAQYRIRVSGPWVWRTHGQVVNAAILGFLYPFRYLLLTDALLERLSAPQVEVIVAHEVAHVRKRHLPWLAASTMGSVLASAWLIELAVQHMPMTMQQRAIGMLVGSLVCMFVGFVVFGFVSRRFEWQADAFALAHITGRASYSRANGGIIEQGDAQLVSNTLQAVAELNGMRTRTFTWRHGSIAERQRRVLESVGARVTELAINRHVAIIKWMSLAALLAGLAPLGWEYVARGSS